MYDLVSLQDAATLIGKNLRTIQRYLKAGTLERHVKDGKNFISRSELEQKFPVVIGGEAVPEPQPPLTSKIAFQERGQAGQVSSKAEAQKYQKSWIEEIQKHAQTREELGVWKGRAEAYQAFATRLLGNGSQKINLEDIKKDDNVSSPKQKNDLSPSLIKGTFIYYLVFGILALVIILLVVIIRIYTSS